MKNTIRFLGIIALAAVIGLGMASCATSGGAKGEASVAPAIDYSILIEMQWPSDEALGNYGLSGLKLPEGTSVLGVPESGNQLVIVLRDADKAVYDNISAQIKALAYTTVEEKTDGTGSAAGYMKMSEDMTEAKMVTVGYSIEENAVVIIAY